MGRRAHRPRRGSLAFSPRVRAPSPIPHIRSWPEEKEVRLLGFAGYKAGMTHVFYIDDKKTSPTAGKEIFSPATVIETPPLKVCGVRLLEKTDHGLRTLTEVWANDLPKELGRRIKLPKKACQEEGMKKAEELLKEGRVAEVRVLVCTQPWLCSGPKKKPDLFEVGVGGPDVLSKWEYCKGLLGKEVRVSEVFKPGEYVDATAITKGKGFQGPVKRWGVKILPRKTDDGRRQVGTLGPWTPARVMWTVPAAGQMGYHQRTELNKRILKIGKGEEVTPPGGFKRWGIVKSDYVLVAGSLPGPTKRLIHLRPATRMRESPGVPVVTYIASAGGKK
ncbi:MAG: 50S ribosomal protein L3 [Candidatus Hadarchaeales archaeon]